MLRLLEAFDLSDNVTVKVGFACERVGHVMHTCGLAH